MPHEDLRKCIADLLGGSLGLNVFPEINCFDLEFGQPGWCKDNPYCAGLRISAFYASLFCGLPWLLFFVAPSCFPRPHMGVVSSADLRELLVRLATTSTQIASSAVSKNNRQ